MLPEKRRLEREVAKLEKVIEKGEEEKALLIEQLSSSTASPSGGTVDYAGIQKRLKELDYDISKATIAWEETASALETFMKEYEKIWFLPKAFVFYAGFFPPKNGIVLQQKKRRTCFF